MLKDATKAVLAGAKTQRLHGLTEYSRATLNHYRTIAGDGLSGSDMAAVEIAFGHTFLLEGRYIAAVRCYSGAGEIARTHDDAFFSLKSRISIAAVLFRQKDFDKAHKMLQQILNEAEDEGFTKIRAQALGLTGEIECIRHGLTEARILHQQALQLHRQLHDGLGEAHQITCLGNVSFGQGDLKLAEECFQHAKALSLSAGDLDQVAVVINNLACVERERRRWDRAIELYEEALEIRRRIGNRAGTANQQEHIADLFNFYIGDRARAIRWYKESIGSLEGIRGRLAGTYQQQELYFAEFFEIYQKLIDLLYDEYLAGRDARILTEIYRYIEHAKAFVLLTRISRSELQGNGPAAPQCVEPAEVREVRSAIASRRGQILGMGEVRSQELERINREILELADHLSDLELTAELEWIAGENLILPRIPSLRELQTSLLEPDEIALSYYVAIDRVFCLAVSSAESDVHCLGTTSCLNTLLDKYMAPFENPDLSRDYTLGREYVSNAHDLWCYLTINGQLVADHGKVFSVAADGRINQVAFESLPAERSVDDPRYVGTTHNVSYYPSIGTMASLRRKAENREMVYYDCRFVGFVNLSDASHDIREQAISQGLYLRRTMRGGDDSLYCQSRATKKRFRHVMEQPICCLHICAHAILGGDDGRDFPNYKLEEPALLLNPGDSRVEDPLLTVSDIRSMDLCAQLVTLSACVTGTGRLVRGEGVDSLARAFLAAGAECVVTSLWPVRLDMATCFMKALYEGLQSRSIADAFFESKKLIAGTYTNPRDWAPLIIVGNSRNKLRLGDIHERHEDRNQLPE